MDVRQHGFIRLAVIVPRVHLGNVPANVAEHLMKISEVRRQGASYIVAPELSLTGYSNGDLFHSQALLEAAVIGLGELLEATAAWPQIISVGLPLLVDGAVYNCAVTIHRGVILAVVPKAYPPEYREFYEQRHFASAYEAQSTVINLLGQTAAFGTDILLVSDHNPRLTIHTEVCEDLWVPIPPSTEAALAGATVLANLSASNITIGKSGYRELLVAGSSAKNLAVQMYSAAGFGESTTDLSWDGEALIAERGEILVRGQRFSLDGGTSVVADVDLELLALERARQNSFRSNASQHPRKFRRILITGQLSDAVQDGLEQVHHKLHRFVDPHPFVPSDQSQRDERCRETFLIQATALARRLEQLPQDRRHVVVGISGGQDSTHALNVAVHAMDLMKMPRRNILAVTMPGFGTTDLTKNNAVALVKAVGAELLVIPVSELSLLMFQNIGHNPDEHDLTYENVQAWARMYTELSLAAEKGGLVLGTGDLSELMLGWCTYLGDHASHYGINAGVPKTLISYLIAWTAEQVYGEKEPEVRGILQSILVTPISPELLPPAADGSIAQRTEDKVGPYELHDFFGYYFVRFGFSPKRIVRLALAAFGDKYSIGEIKSWFRLFLTRFFRNQFKRSCLPDGPKVGLTCISPRGDWRMPSDADPTVWLQDLELVPDNLN